MNARQAAKAAAKRIEELEHITLANKWDIQQYNKCIQDMIAGESPCLYCEDWNECQLEAKGGKGCPEWILKFWKAGDLDAVRASEGDTNDSVLSVEKQ